MQWHGNCVFNISCSIKLNFCCRKQKWKVQKREARENCAKGEEDVGKETKSVRAPETPWKFPEKGFRLHNGSMKNWTCFWRMTGDRVIIVCLKDCSSSTQSPEFTNIFDFRNLCFHSKFMFWLFMVVSVYEKRQCFETEVLKFGF